MKTKRERFESVAANRVQRILSSLDSLSKCANSNNYEYSEDDVKKMIHTLKNKIKFVEDVFHQNLNKSKINFKF